MLRNTDGDPLHIVGVCVWFGLTMEYNIQVRQKKCCSNGIIIIIIIITK